MKQYYACTFSSPFWYDEDKKVIVNSVKELRDYVKQEFQFLQEQYPIDSSFKSEIVKVFKRLKTSRQYTEFKDGHSETSGYVFTLEYCPTEEYMEKHGDYGYQSYMSYWCSRITKKEIADFALSEFEEIKN